MAQISYGTITITDTNDIERIYVVYAKHTSNTDSTGLPAAANWKELIAEAPGSGNYIWQRTVVKKSGITTLAYGDPVCVTGPQGIQGIQGPEGEAATNITDIQVQYGISANWNTQPSSWSNNSPDYDSTKPNYWTRTRLVYEDGTYSDWVVNQDHASTEAIANAVEANYNAAVANSIAQSANENAQGAMSQAAEAQYATEALDTKLKNFFWPGDSNYPGAYAVGKGTSDGLNVEDISTYGYNLRLTPATLSIGYNEIKAIEIDGSNPALRFYAPSKTTQATSPSMELSSTSLVFNNPSTGRKNMELSSSGLTFYDGSSATGGNIQAQFGASGAIQSGNYSRGSDNKFSTSGTKIDLTSGDIITEYFRLSQGGEAGGPNAGAYIHGTIEALSGRIGGYNDNGSTTNNYWDIGNFTDYNLQRSAKMIGHGSSFIQLGDSSTWRLATNRIHTGWYEPTQDSYLHFPIFTTDGSTTADNKRRWDYGMHIPTAHDDKFLYIRTASATTALSNLVNDLEDTHSTHYWTYNFWIDGEGRVHAPGFYVGNSTTPIGGGANTIAQKIINQDGSTYGKGSTTQPVYIDSSGYVQSVGWSSETSLTNSNEKIPTSAAVKSFVENKGYVTSSGVTSVTIGATSPVVSSTATEQIGSTVSTTISLANNYGDTKNPYASKTKNYVLAAPATENGVPTFRALVLADIPISNWAKQSTKPSYSFSELTSHPTTISGYGITDAIITGTGTRTGDYLVKFSGQNTITQLVKLTSGGTGYLKEDGTWGTPGGTYNLPIATYNLLGGIKPWYSTTGTSSLANSGDASTYTTNVSVNQRSSTSGRYYPVETDKNGRIFVNVPWTNVNSNYLTEITSTMVTDALGFTPYNSTNPSGYTTNTGTVTSVATNSPITGGPITTTGTIGHATSGVGNGVTSAGFYKFKYDTYGHVTGVTTVTKSDITGLGIPGTDTDTHHTAYLYDTTDTGTTRVTTNTTDPYLTLVENGEVRSRIQLKAGTNITSITANNGVITFAAKDTTYTAATAAPGKVASSSAKGSSTNYARQDHTHGIDLATGDANGQVKIAGTNVSVKGLGSWAYKSSGSASDVGLSNVINAKQITNITNEVVDNVNTGRLVIWRGADDSEVLEVEITAREATSAVNAQKATGDENGNRIYTSYAASLDWTTNTRALVLKSKSGAQLSSVTIPDTTYSFADSYNASTNKGATVATVTNAINALDVTAITGSAGQTITSISETNGKISATYSNISITKSQISDFPTSMTPAAHNHSQIVTVGDKRSTETTPNNYANALIFQGLKSKATIGSPSDDNYSYLIGLRGWSDSSGGNSHELAFNNTGIFWRQGATTSWGSWYRIYTTGNKPTASDVGLGNVANSDTTNASNITSGTLAKERLATSGATAGSYGDSGNQTPGYGSTFKVPYITVDTYGRVTSISEHTVKIPASDNSNTWRKVQVNGTDILGTATSTNPLNLKAGNNVTITNSSGTVTIESSYTNTDTKVTQAYSTANNSYPLLFSATAGVSSTDSRGDVTAILTNGIYANPSTNTITATTFNGNASSATAFSSGTTVKLTGNVTGESSSSTKGWTVSTSIGTGVVTNAMLAGSIANSKLSNSSITINNTAVSLGGSINVGTVTKVTAGTGLKIGAATSGGDITSTGTINHINSVTAKTAAAQSAKTLTWGGTFTLYEEKYDAQGHITGVASYNMTMPSNPNSDTKVKLTSMSTAGSYPLIFGPTSISSGSDYQAYYNTNIIANPAEGIIKSTKGIFNELVATNANVTNLTATNAKVVGILDVTQGELHTSKWTNANISNIGGSFYISPTVNTEYASGNTSYMTVTVTGDANNRTIAITGGSFATDAAKYYDSDGTHTADWAANSKVMVTGNIRVGNSGVDYPLGTCIGYISGNKLSSGGFTVAGVSSPALESIITELGTTSFKSKNITISMYEIGDANDATILKPVGIMLTSYGNNNSTYIDIYGGVNVKTDGIVEPNVRIGYLGDGTTNYGLSRMEGDTQYPTGWGIYTDNGYFKGTVVASSGKIAGWTIGAAAIYSGTDSMRSTEPGTYIGVGVDEAGGIRNYASAEAYVNISQGIITAKGVNLTGEINATSGNIGGLTITNNQIQITGDKISLGTNTLNTFMNIVKETVNNVETDVCYFGNSSNRIAIYEDKISFYSGGTETAYISNQEMNIPRIIVLDTMKAGNWIWDAKTQPNHLTLRWNVS